MNVPRIEISPPGAPDYDPQKQNQFNHPSPSISPVDHSNFNYQSENFYPSWSSQQHTMSDRLRIGSPHNSYYSSPDVSPMGSRNSSYSELDVIGKSGPDYISPRQFGYEGGHSDSECISDSTGKKRKISNRPRSDSCFDHFSLRGQMSWVMPSWIRAYPPKFGNIEMKITRQPTNHRAQYIGEGSRGPMRSQKGYPAVKISNYKGSGLLRLYLATEDDPIRYHPFYQVCKVMTKAGPQIVSNETIIDKVKVIELPFQIEEKRGKTIEICIAGILKLKNSQVEAALGDYGVVHPRSTRVRLVIMAILMDENHKEIILQNVSDPIACNQISSEPVILKTSIDRDDAIGGSELWIIGKHFRHIRVVFQEKDADGNCRWEAEADVNKVYLASNHLICIVPPYTNQNISSPVKCEVQLITQYKDQLRYSPTKEFTYLPNNNALKQECQSDELTNNVKKLDIKEKVMLKEIGKTDSFDRMISALKHSVDQHLNQQQSRYDGGASGATQAGWDPQHQENIFN